MNSARIEGSPRLQRVLKVLKDKKRHTTRGLIRMAGVCAVNSCIAELRENGYGIECERDGRVWRYWLA